MSTIVIATDTAPTSITVDGVAWGPPVPVPPTGGNMILPKTEADLRAALNQMMSSGTMLMLDPATNVTVSGTITLNTTVQCASGAEWGIIGNGAKINWNGPGGQDILQIVGAGAFQARSLLVEGLTFNGNGYAAPAAGACLKLSCPNGVSPIYKATLRDIFTMEATNGVVLEGAVFESSLYNVHAENHQSDGVVTRSLPNGVISNIFIYGINSSRNFGAGLNCDYSTNVYGGSFILNGKGGILAPNGCRLVDGVNGENTGESVIILGGNGYGSVVMNCEASSDGQTVCRQFVNGQWVNIGVPELYVVDMTAAPTTIQQNNHCSYYGPAPNPMRVVK